jgi:hypothetical protein
MMLYATTWLRFHPCAHSESTAAARACFGPAGAAPADGLGRGRNGISPNDGAALRSDEDGIPRLRLGMTSNTLLN